MKRRDLNQKLQKPNDATLTFRLPKKLKDSFIDTAIEAGKEPDEELRQIIASYCGK